MRYAISDIHGCVRTFKKALSVVGFSKTDKLFLLGDYIDRGPDSKGVLDYIINLISEGYNVTPLRGNHEEFLIVSYEECLNSGPPSSPYRIGQHRSGVTSMWLHNGGHACLDSFGVKYPDEINKKYIDFCKTLMTYHVEKDFVFVHAGLDFSPECKDPITDSSDDCRLWSRTRIADSSRLGNRILVSGHTPRTKPQMISSLETDNWLIDRGCVFQQSDYGHLAILNLDTKQFNFVKNIDMIERD